MEKLYSWIADRLPKKIIYFCGIRLWAHGTTGKYGNTEAPTLTVADALDRWKGKR
jgi:hypothetical protein